MRQDLPTTTNPEVHGSYVQYLAVSTTQRMHTVVVRSLRTTMHALFYEYIAIRSYVVAI